MGPYRFVVITRCGCKWWVNTVINNGVITLIITILSIFRIIRPIVIDALSLGWYVVFPIIISFNLFVITVGEFYYHDIIVWNFVNTVDDTIWNGQ